MKLRPDEYDYYIAKENGISRSCVDQRLKRNWKLEKAITKKVTISDIGKEWTKFKHIAKQNGITQSSFYYRVENGMDPKSAATMKPYRKKLPSLNS